MNIFSSLWTAFFAAFTTFATTSRRMFKKIIDLLVKQKAAISAVEGNITNIQGDVTSIKGNVTTLQGDVLRLGQIKGNYDPLPYNYGKDTAVDKPVAGISAANLFAYVLAKLALVATPGKTYQIQLSGEQSLPIDVNGDTESGNPSENLMVIVAESGAQSFVFQSNLQDEYIKVISTKAEATTVVLASEQSEMNTYEALLDAMAA